MPKGRSLKRNPYYYHPRPAEEWRELYTAILDSVTRKSKELLVLCESEELYSLADSFNSPKIRFYYPDFWNFRLQYEEWYRAPHSHPSALGYQLYAGEVFAYLQGEKDFQFKRIHLLRDALPEILFDPELGKLEEINQMHWSLE